jgi:hypothetical protein
VSGDDVATGKISFELAGATAEITSDGSRSTFVFPRGHGLIEPRRFEFRDRQELVEYLAENLRLSIEADGVRGSVWRTGKYTRRNSDGDLIHTFGDPILDMITNDHGDLFIGGQRLPLAQEELREPRYRVGGVSTLDLGSLGEDFERNYIQRAVMGEGDYVLVTRVGRLTAFASKNPSQRDFFQDGDHLRFKAWKKSRFLYWSMGAEVETWGQDFDRAEVQSRYLDTVVGQTCAAVKLDSDNDTDDDYLDEYEWGVNAPQPLRVVSLCTARWKNQNFAGQVEAGPACFEI